MTSEKSLAAGVQVTNRWNVADRVASERMKRWAARMLRRGTTRLDVDWEPVSVGLVAMEPVKKITKKRFLGMGRDLSMAFRGNLVEIGLEGMGKMVLNGIGVGECYRSIPEGFKYSQFRLTSSPQLSQEEIDYRAEHTAKLLSNLSANLIRDPGSFAIGSRRI
ncbi:MAG: hypothetical protein KGH94_05550 [Candidatus Micrarchaeota archaeon]|nr:hypothetical protein [Candidatus Micrarchaeota archaeon]